VVKKLISFGFTVNQAKVYLSIVQAGSVSAGIIAKVTQLHRQDIYKILPKLEKNGLITKTINKPFIIEAIPVETALNQLVFNEREKASRKIALLEDNLKGLVASLNVQPKNEEEARFSLLTTDGAIRNKATLSFKELKKEVKLVTSLELLLSPLAKLNEFIQLLSLRKTNTLMLAATLENKEVVRNTIEKLAPNKTYFTAKLISKNIYKHYMIIDQNEIWIATEQRTESGFPCILWTNDRNIIHVYEEYFDKGWNHSGAITIYSPRDFQTRELITT
jgi:sugar-specific transcriptional regulator TrmB